MVLDSLYHNSGRELPMGSLPANPWVPGAAEPWQNVPQPIFRSAPPETIPEYNEVPRMHLPASLTTIPRGAVTENMSTLDEANAERKQFNDNSLLFRKVIPQDRRHVGHYNGYPMYDPLAIGEQDPGYEFGQGGQRILENAGVLDRSYNHGVYFTNHLH